MELKVGILGWLKIVPILARMFNIHGYTVHYVRDQSKEPGLKANNYHEHASIESLISTCDIIFCGTQDPLETEDIEECYLGENMEGKGFVLLTPIDNDDFIRRLADVKIHYFGGMYMNMSCVGGIEKLKARDLMVSCHGDLKLYEICKPLIDVCSSNPRFIEKQPSNGFHK